jgi:hypothetical protein
MVTSRLPAVNSVVQASSLYDSQDGCPTIRIVSARQVLSHKTGYFRIRLHERIVKNSRES